MRRAATPTILAALALAATSGCGVDDSPKSATTQRPPSSAKATCAGAECKVRVTCKGKVQTIVGPAPVQVRTARTALVSTIYADFAGSRNDATIRC